MSVNVEIVHLAKDAVSNGILPYRLGTALDDVDRPLWRVMEHARRTILVNLRKVLRGNGRNHIVGIHGHLGLYQALLLWIFLVFDVQGLA